MEWVVMGLPGLISVEIRDRLMKREDKSSIWVRQAGCYIFITNLLTMCVFQYLLGLDTGFQAAFADNLFLIHYGMINLFFAVVLPLLRVRLKPLASLELKNKGE